MKGGSRQRSDGVPSRDVTTDFLLCNRCGACRAVCPVCEAIGEEWAGARGKVEIAEAFFRGEDIGEKELREVFDMCLHCMTCEANCPSGMRADEVILAVRAEMAMRGMIPWWKRLLLRAIEGMDSAVFKLMRALRLTRRSPLHGVGGKSVMSVFYPLLGWPRQRFFPLPRDRSFLASNPEFFPASFFDGTLEGLAELDGLPGDFDRAAAEDLVSRFESARAGNRRKGRSAYFFLGHTVNHFFPEEAESIVYLLNLLGIDVHVPADQVCCGAPAFYAGDIEAARRSAAKAVERISRVGADLIVTSCASGGRMIRHEFPRLLDITEDGFFEIGYDRAEEVFTRKPAGAAAGKECREAAERYKARIQGKVFDVNEVLADELGLEEPAPSGDGRPVVTYHHPCHLARGQDVDWQPEMVLRSLPGWRYVRMEDADVCCGGGGTFTFLHPEEGERIAERKLAAISRVLPEAVSTACPICRIQLMDMMRRRFVLEAGERGEPEREIPVLSPAELLAGDVRRILRSG